MIYRYTEGYDLEEPDFILRLLDFVQEGSVKFLDVMQLLFDVQYLDRFDKRLNPDLED